VPEIRSPKLCSRRHKSVELLPSQQVQAVSHRPPIDQAVCVVVRCRPRQGPHEEQRPQVAAPLQESREGIVLDLIRVHGRDAECRHREQLLPVCVPSDGAVHEPDQELLHVTSVAQPRDELGVYHPVQWVRRIVAHLVDREVALGEADQLESPPEGDRPSLLGLREVVYAEAELQGSEDRRSHSKAKATFAYSENDRIQSFEQADTFCRVRRTLCSGPWV
jgi:hypothetical protein